MIITDKLLQEDIPQFWAIDKAVWTCDNTPALFQYEDFDRYAEGLWRQQLLIAKDESTGEVLGSVSYHHPSPLPGHSRQWELGISIAPKAQGQGVGRRLMEELIRRAPAEKIGKISLKVFTTNPGARTFYKKLGFVDEGLLQKEFWLDGRWVDEYLMAYYIDDTLSVES